MDRPVTRGLDEEDLERHPNLDVRVLNSAKVREKARAFLEVDQSDHIARLEHRERGMDRLAPGVKRPPP
jgi:hypothetical protein